MSNDTTHPTHYARLSPEPIDVIEAWGLGPAFHVGNAIKYLARAGHKAGADAADDLAKAEWYVARARQAASGEKLTDATMIERLQADLDRLRAPVTEAEWEEHGENCHDPREALETLLAARGVKHATAHDWTTRDLAGRLRDTEDALRESNRLIAALQQRECDRAAQHQSAACATSESPKRKARAAKGGAS